MGIFIDPIQVLGQLQPVIQLMKDNAEGAVVYLMAIQILLGGIELMRGKREWSHFGYPIAGAVLVFNYDTVIRELVAVPQELGWAFAATAVQSALQQMVKHLEVTGSFLTQVGEIAWATEMAVMLSQSIFVAGGAMFFLQYLQVAGIGFLAAVGPIMLMTAAFRPTAKWAVKWATMVVELSCWTLVWGVLLFITVALTGSIPDPNEIDWNNSGSIFSMFQTGAMNLMFLLACCGTPILTHALFGVGMGRAVSSAVFVVTKVL